MLQSWDEGVWSWMTEGLLGFTPVDWTDNLSVYNPIEWDTPDL